MKCPFILFLSLALLSPFHQVFASDIVETQTLYLSGTGSDDAVEWEFFCTAGAGSGEWTTIPVPSCWECQGFGHISILSAISPVGTKFCPPSSMGPSGQVNRINIGHGALARVRAHFYMTFLPAD